MSEHKPSKPTNEPQPADKITVIYNEEGRAEAEAWRRHRERQRRPVPLPKVMTGNELAKDALREVADIWQVEAIHITQSDNSFDWTPGSHTVHVRASQHADGRPRVRLSVETDYLRNIPIQKDSFCRLLGAAAHFETSTYSLVYPPHEIWKEYGGEEPTYLSLFSSAYISEQTALWLPRFLAQMAIMQPINAEIRSATMPEIFGGGAPAYARGEKVSVREDILEVANAIYLPAGSSGSRWIGSDEFGRFAAEYGRSDQCYANGDPNGLTLEIPFGSSSALIRFRTEDAHPQLRNGLLVTVQIPFWSNLTEVINEAAFLNFWESRTWTDFPQFGCWHPHVTDYTQGDPVQGDKAALAHSSFIPNALYSDGLVINFALWSMARVQWVKTTR